MFGDPPGAYGVGMDMAMLASAWENEDDLVKYFVQNSAFAYGKGLGGVRKIQEFVDVGKRVDVSTDITQSRRASMLSCGYGTTVAGGFRLLAKRAGKRTIRQYQALSEKDEAVTLESLGENLKRNAENTVLNAFWLTSVMERGYDGAGDIMSVVQTRQTHE